MSTRTKRNRGGVTLVEILVVIAIIGILIAILVPTLYGVVERAQQARIAQEISQMKMSIDSYTQKYGDRPPDCSDNALVIRHLRKAFPRMKDNWVNSNMTRPDGTPALHPATGARANLADLDPDEALVFWLGMLKNDPRLPLNGNGELAKDFEFDLDRLVDLEAPQNPGDPPGDGWYSYVPQDGPDAPYVYFDSRTYCDISNTPPTPLARYDVDPTAGTLYLYPYAKTLPVASTKSFVNPTTFQIISAGVDNEFGAATRIFPIPDPIPATLTLEREYLDNQANFSDVIFEDHME